MTSPSPTSRGEGCCKKIITEKADSQPITTHQDQPQRSLSRTKGWPPQPDRLTHRRHWSLRLGRLPLLHHHHPISSSEGLGFKHIKCGSYSPYLVIPRSPMVGRIAAGGNSPIRTETLVHLHHTLWHPHHLKLGKRFSDHATASRGGTLHMFGCLLLCFPSQPEPQGRIWGRG